jgi:hypothetical protein
LKVIYIIFSILFISLIILLDLLAERLELMLGITFSKEFKKSIKNESFALQMNDIISLGSTTKTLGVDKFARAAQVIDSFIEITSYTTRNHDLLQSAIDQLENHLFLNSSSSLFYHYYLGLGYYELSWYKNISDHHLKSLDSISRSLISAMEKFEWRNKLRDNSVCD